MRTKNEATRPADDLSSFPSSASRGGSPPQLARTTDPAPGAASGTVELMEEAPIVPGQRWRGHVFDDSVAVTITVALAQPYLGVVYGHTEDGPCLIGEARLRESFRLEEGT
jgi:hypothetical protein